MDTNTEYVMIPKSFLEANKISIDHTLTPKEVVKIKINKKLISKFIRQKAISMQFDIWAWLWRWEESLGLKLVDALWVIATDIDNIWDVFDKFKQEQAKESEETKD